MPEGWVSRIAQRAFARSGAQSEHRILFLPGARQAVVTVRPTIDCGKTQGEPKAALPFCVPRFLGGSAGSDLVGG